MHETDNLMRSAIATLNHKQQNATFRPMGENIQLTETPCLATNRNSRPCGQDCKYIDPVG